ncbi:MAG: [FeFe] hydrogenase, group A [Firmicutes bacterium]|nr:[FeFe] hydrogenase, group A [Bacillota bacterium]
MGTITINGKKVEFTNEKNLLTIIRKAGIEVPTLCYQPELSIFGACRLCMVEDDKGRCFASCSEEPRDGMVIYTHTERLRKNRKLIVELLLAAHCRDCTTCDKHGKCKLQKLAYQLGVNNVRFENHREVQPVDFSSPSIVRDPNKCILCGCCVRACAEIQGIGVLGFAHRGTDAIVTPAFNRNMAETDCVSCGQCRVVCPTGALTIHHNMTEVWQALGDKNTRVVAQIAPAVRVAVGEAFGLPKGENAMGKIVAALHRMGFDEVFDTSYSADLTIMEESAEFLDRVQNGGTLPLLTSCCPAWVKFVENEFPEFKPNVSTCRSPQGMFSAVLKDYYRDEANAQGKKTVVVSIMPCTAKKMEANRKECYTKGEKDTDYVLTTTELIRMINANGINFETLPSESCDMPFGIGSGGGVIFGTTGGVTEAVLRRLIEGHDPATLSAIAECGVRGDEGIREFTVPYNGMDVKICVASGLANARKVLQSVKSGEKQYHFIEVMACPGGCVMGGGQPIYGTKVTRAETRTRGLYAADGSMAIKKPNENPLMDVFYNGYFKGKAHELLHNPHE